MGLAHSPRIVTNGLVLCLDAANRKSYPGSGTAWTDLSGRGNNGTLTNGPTYSSANGGAIVFDGVNDYVAVPSNQSIELTTLSVSVWFKITFPVTGNPAEIVSKHNSSGSVAGWGIWAATTGAGTYVKSDNASNYFTVGDPINSSIWNNIVVNVTNNGSIVAYINGVLGTSASVGSLNTPTTQELRIGRSNDSYWQPYGGTVATSFIYNRVLTQAEILQNFNALRGRFGI